MTSPEEKDLLSLGANFCRVKPSTLSGLDHLIGEFLGFAQLLYTAKALL